MKGLRNTAAHTLQMPKITKDDLKHHAINSSLFPATTLGRAVQRLGFIQADPLRVPARAQDLILRHRVRDYVVGNLDRGYKRLALEEDFLYAYGFMPRTTWRLLHPRAGPELTATERRVLEIVTSKKSLHPQELDAHLGKEREINAWGTYSKSTTRCLERLLYRGLIRITGRANGVRLYGGAAASHDPLEPEERLRQLVLLIANIFSPSPESGLRAVIQHLRHGAPELQGRRSALDGLIDDGQIDSAKVDGVRYLWPKGRINKREPQNVVRFLAPFDPVVWDRRRFEHFWEWRYRFEAYTPTAKRQRGYYALPLLWRSDIIGWVNISGGPNDLRITPGFVRAEHASDAAFKGAYALEVERLRTFLFGSFNQNNSDERSVHTLRPS